GVLDEIRAYDRALNSTEIARLVNGTPWCAPNLNIDPNNCGACGNSCNTTIGGSCQAGTCTIPCGNHTNCSNVCVATSSDNNNCGGCGVPCNSGNVPTCCGGGCADLDSDPNNCGFCGNVCGASITTDGLIGYWSFSECGGWDAYDNSGNG